MWIATVEEPEVREGTLYREPGYEIDVHTNTGGAEGRVNKRERCR